MMGFRVPAPFLEQSDFHSCFHHRRVRVEPATVRTNRCNNPGLCDVAEKWRGVVAGAVLRGGWGEGGAAFLAVRTPSSGDMSDAFVIL